MVGQPAARCVYGMFLVTREASKAIISMHSCKQKVKPEIYSDGGDDAAAAAADPAPAFAVLEQLKSTFYTYLPES